MPQLDALRTFAVFAVMIHHFWPEATLNLPLGFVGVQLFFVLSGFLITGILWPAREAVQSGRWPAPTVFGRFYARRVLRIFPLFYGTLAVLFVVGLYADSALTMQVAAVWTAHIAMDRALGYGLKLPTDFRDTHLGRIGRS